ncbi:hypothetical protein [Nonomuraea sp. NPDC003804]|uniref:hypothetical protein n=1 Tax=Nonomuraea sp. NPDC003804 TaxID=3154547 RepID=UPI0033A11CFA
MPLPQPEGLEDRIRALEQAVRDLQSSITNRSGLTTASAGWVIPNQGTPSPPGDGGHLTALGDEPYWTESSGSSYSLRTPPFPKGVAVSNPVLVLGDAPASYNSTFADTQSAAINEVHNRLIDLLGSLRGAPLINSF